MAEQSHIVLTGAAGFIGSCMAAALNAAGMNQLILVDDFGVEAKRNNWEGKSFATLVERQSLETWLSETNLAIGGIIHLGARTDTTEFDYAVHEALNVEYSKMLWRYAATQQIPFVYASSAATYGAGECGYSDGHEWPQQLKPLNPYGVSKNEFDKWALQQTDAPPAWAGLKFFNVYGPNEGHKGRMASVVWHGFQQIKATGEVKLFKSHRPDFKDGEQLRDFIYVKDLVKVIDFLYQKMVQHDWRAEQNGLYNLGTGVARSFHDLTVATFKGMDLLPQIRFIDMPIDIRDTYQYFTQADMHKLRTVAGYTAAFYSLEEGIDDYVRHYLVPGQII
ncbi:MAG: ADP-glyceromanno-heptose 6-epimerase [Sphingobacteriia bacterium]|nr:MAG: ADP-glyceromanno-heptose 6-epimerase [Sphingobacteriia bacterium]